tara:strand:+ start:18 stop:1139 length:1122 start_codon:yes stop_codon:yes gene_type:complete
MSEIIPIAGPWITDLEVNYTADAAANGWYEKAGSWPQRFERTFAEYVGTKFAISLPHCTAGIHLALHALGIGPGDEVIVPDITWIATAAPVKYLGATPVFADVDKSTWCLSKETVSKVITKKTKAIIPVDLYGSMPNWDELKTLSSHHGIHLLEDAAEAFGSEREGKKAGSFGIVGLFSFHGSKTITTGEGGMLVTDDSEIYQRVLFLRDHGRPPGDRFFNNTEVAFKYRMSALQAAFGTAQVERANEIVDKKREIFSWYKKRLKGLPLVLLNHEQNGFKNSYWMTTIILDKDEYINKEELMKILLEKGIQTRPFFNQLSQIPAFRNEAEAIKARARNHVSAYLAPRGINLPSALSLTEESVDYVCNSLKQIL